MEHWDLALRTLYAEFQEAVRSRASLEAEIWRRPAFVTKKIKGNVYWYRQTYKEGLLHQTYLGPSTPELKKKILAGRTDRRDVLAMLRKTVGIERKRSAMLRRAGIPCLDSKTAALLSHFSSLGLVDRNGVLVGSLAFSAYPAMLGYLFEKDSLKTMDVDLARSSPLKDADEIEISAVFPKSLSSFKAIPTLNLKQPPYSFANPDGLRVDFLVPLMGREKDSYRMPGVAGAGAQALRMLDYLIEMPIPTVLIGPRGGIPVTVPQPVRFALHKLLTASRRDASQSAKRKKDYLQASQLIVACQEEQPEELRAAIKTAMKRGAGWEKSFKQAIPHLTAEAQVLIERRFRNIR